MDPIGGIGEGAVTGLEHRLNSFCGDKTPSAFAENFDHSRTAMEGIIL